MKAEIEQAHQAHVATIMKDPLFGKASTLASSLGSASSSMSRGLSLSTRGVATNATTTTPTTTQNGRALSRARRT
eukprot:4526318-Pyramimonas_sp.AAC.1